jgi:hypothetical protein
MAGKLIRYVKKILIRVRIALLCRTDTKDVVTVEESDTNQ